MKIKLEGTKQPVPLYCVVISDQEIRLVSGREQLPLLEYSFMPVGNPPKFMFQIFWDLPGGKPEPESKLRHFHLTRIVGWMSKLADLGDVMFGIGHVPPDSVEELQIFEEVES